VASGYAVAQTTLAPEVFRKAAHGLQVGGPVNVEALLKRWVQMGYEPVPAVEMPGTFSRRGGILDVWSPDAEAPVRIELFGNLIDSMRTFDAATQRSIAQTESASIVPARELLPEVVGSVDLDLSTLEAEDREAYRADLAQLAQGMLFPGAEFYAPLFQRTTLLDYLPPETVVVVDRSARLQASFEELTRRGEEVRDSQVERGKLPHGFPSPIASWERLERALADVPRRLHLEPFSASPVAEREGRSFGSLGFDPPDTYGGNTQDLSDDLAKLRQAGQAVVVASLQAQRLTEILQESGHELSSREAVDVQPSPGSLTVVRQGLAEGWALDHNVEDARGGGVILLTDAEVFGFIKRQRPFRRRVVRRDAFLSDFQVGDYVVHVEHGIARFEGTVKRMLDRTEREYLVLGYAEGDTLYVPTDQMDRVSRYVGSGGPPSLSRLGGTEWAQTKKKAKEAALEFARELLRLYAVREVQHRTPFTEDTPWQWELESSFPYQETPDQHRAIQQIKEDLESPKPMDRLLCGDVGYGKTEVALRAAFKAVNQGSQVAVLVPTTVLAQQHFHTFQDRLKPFPVRVEMLSRLRSEQEQREALDALAKGDVDIIIGTHRLLSKDVQFKNLGLIILDEEQRFGVRHKEHLKKMRTTVDVLTMTATPIPRTLHMALFGIRDMSRIETPPEERIPVATYVAEYDERAVREAVLREMDRGGQVYFVHNRIQDIHHIEAKLRELLPEATFAVAHGRMPPETLEKVMDAFSAGEMNVLICTTIIQAGLDIPNANTLIVDEADKLGLTQLYQLRGRVGRSSVRAYAYFLFKRDRVLTQTAEQRLRAILSATELGAGFRIAMKDLEIRGAGNILGSEQSGHVAAVGFSLYTRLLAEAVEEVRGRHGDHLPGHEERRELIGDGAPRPSVELPVDAYIPESYVEDVSTRLAVYERLVRLSRLEEIEEVRKELEDRFGPLPQEVQDLLLAVDLRARASKLMGAVQAIAREGMEVVIRFRDASWLDREGLRRAIPGVQVGHLQVRMSIRPGSRWRTDLQKALQALEGQIVRRAPALAQQR
jgi:transcription-repair coupling factor (superfamily II helicase)